MRNLKHSKHQYRLIKKNSLGPKMYRPREKYYGIAFEFDPYDDDDHPSVPHGDSYNHYYKLDLRNGNVYAKREKIGHLKEKEFEKLQHDKRKKISLFQLRITTERTIQKYHLIQFLGVREQSL